MRILNLFVCAERHVQNALARLPPFLGRFLGYRPEAQKPLPTYVESIWGFIGAFGSIGILIFGHTQYFGSRHVPLIVASFGASAVLVFGAIESPYAQPRALIFGHFLGALTGVVVATIFQFQLDQDSVPHLQWLAMCLAVSLALVVMRVTKTTHSPAGVTALLPCLDPHVWALRWYYLPVVLTSSALVLASALLVNNIQYRYPKYWIAPSPARKASNQHRHRAVTVWDSTTQQHHPRSEYPLPF